MFALLTIVLSSSLAFAADPAPPAGPDPVATPDPTPPVATPDPTPAPPPPEPTPPAPTQPPMPEWVPAPADVVSSATRHFDDQFLLSAELSSLASADSTFDLFSHRDAIASGGIRAGWRPLRRVMIFADWQHGRTGLTFYEPGSTSGALDGFSLGTNQFRAGAAVNALWLSGVLRPYVAADLIALQATSRFDDDTYDPNSPGQVSSGGFTAGGEGLIGLQVVTRPIGGLNLGISLHLEGGYAVLAPFEITTGGSVRAGGAVIRSGLGVVF